ncbi:MAG TPA: FecR family protein, partial [Flavobacteriaceae bacterium]
MKELFIKYVKRECTKEEVQQIVSYFQNSKDFSEFPTIEAIYHLLEEFPEMDEASANRISKSILKATRKVPATPIKKKPQFWRYAAAAILIIALASTYFLRDTIFNNQIQIENTTPIIVNNQIAPGIDKATLTLEDGTEMVLVKGASVQTKNATSNGEEIIYQQTTGNRQPATNTLTIPRGGQFFITLADGTKVWLNSETQIKYPVSFVKGQSRQVELVYGEAYFDVSPSTAHGGSNFKVFNNNQEVEVLGTEFNIKAYKDEINIFTTLVEGKVAVS